MRMILAILIQICTMMTDVLVIAAAGLLLYAGYKSHNMILGTCIAGMGLWVWIDDKMFLAWRPSDIRQFIRTFSL